MSLHRSLREPRGDAPIVVPGIPSVIGKGLDTSILPEYDFFTCKGLIAGHLAPEGGR